MAMYQQYTAILLPYLILDNGTEFFNLCKLHKHFEHALKKIPYPQSTVNGWAGAMLSPAMYALIDPTVFHWKIATTIIPEFPACYATNPNGTQGALIVYTREELLTITAILMREKHYHDTRMNIRHAVFDVLDGHINDTFKTAPAGSPNTIGWNSMMLLNKIFDQLMTTYMTGKSKTKHIHFGGKKNSNRTDRSEKRGRFE